MLLEELVHERENGEKYVSAYDLHEWLEVKSRFNDWIKNRVKKYKFEENRHYILVTKSLVTNNPKNPTTNLSDYELTIRVAEQLCMVENNEKGLEARNYFMDLEEYVEASEQSPEFNYWRLTGKVLRKGLTDTIKEELNPDNCFVYSNYTDLVYKKIFGKKCKEIKEKKGLGKNDSLRDNLSPEELEEVSKWENKVKSMIETFKLMGLDNKEIYSKIKELLGIK